MKSIRAAFWSLLLILFGCSTAPSKAPTSTGFYPEVTEDRKSAWQNMVGNWYGSMPLENGGTYAWLISRNIFGKYKLEGKIHSPNGEVKTQIEIGEWGIGGGVYFSIFKGWVEHNEFIPNDQSDPYYRDVYKIISLDNKKLTYKHLDSGQTYSVVKVDDSYVLSDKL